MRTSPASRPQQLCGGSVGTRPGSAWRCSWPGLPHLCFHCALGWHRRRPSQELRSAHTSALFNLVLSCPLITTDTTRVSIGAGSAPITRANASLVNTSGCGWHYSLRCSLASRCFSGRKVVCRSPKGGGGGPTFTSPNSMKLLNT
jgi:hypothetical protein